MNPVPFPKIGGIDFGSKLAGTTRIIWLDEAAKLRCLGSARKQDADALILDWVKKEQPTALFIDAPLSLPAVYTSANQAGSYFYRQADKEMQAMSPMFLGGLTARAMQLQAQLRSIRVELYEVYPAALARVLDLKSTGYKEHQIQTIHREIIESNLPFPICWEEITDWHGFDALLAFLSGWRYQNGAHQAYGDPLEGLIYV